MKILPKSLLYLLGSSKLALVLVLLVILCALAGAVLPQKGAFTDADIAVWQEAHPFISSLSKPLGGFRVFHSVFFLSVVFLLGLNTLTCTVTHFIEAGGFRALKGPDGRRLVGFCLLHLCLILLMAGGFWSAAARMDGFILLTEGQQFIENRMPYLRLVEGPLCAERSRGFDVRLKKVDVTYENKFFPAAISSVLEFREAGEAQVKVNFPYSYRGRGFSLDFTLDQVGYSPHVVIREKKSGRMLVNSFVALKTFREGDERDYRDFLPLPVFRERGQQVILTLFPGFERMGGAIKKTGNSPDNPILLVDIKKLSGETITAGDVTLGGRVQLDRYDIGFAGLRRWATFRVVEDPGYPLVWVAIWLGVAAMILRYWPDLRGLFVAGGSDDMGPMGR